MSTFLRLSQVYKSSLEIEFDDSSKFIFFSDCHRGDNSWADDFSKNKDIFMIALDFYYNSGYRYIEVGDGDELWENYSFQLILKSHEDAFQLMKKYYDSNRLYMISGNHDMVKRCHKYVKSNLYGYKCKITNKYHPVFDKITIHEGLILKYKETGGRLLVVHGHQGDLLNDYLWPVACFMTRHIWRRLEILGIKNVLSPAKFNPLKDAAEERIKQWVFLNKLAIITGHTHRQRFPGTGRLPYFNAGSCVDRSGITGIEIQNGEIALIKWVRITKEAGDVEIKKEVLGGPHKLKDVLHFKGC